MFWFFGRDACGILAHRPAIEAAAPALEGKVLSKLQEKAMRLRAIGSNVWAKWGATEQLMKSVLRKRNWALELGTVEERGNLRMSYYI